jgi:hypothetical protein
LRLMTPASALCRVRNILQREHSCYRVRQHLLCRSKWRITNFFM